MISRFFSVLAAALCFSLAACGGGSGGVAIVLPTLSGVWGGQHIGLTISDSGASLAYDCAHGTIDGQIRLDQTGRFSVNGIHVIGQPGPTTPGATINSHPARYDGQVQQDSLSLTVTLTDTGQNVGTFLLTRNGTAQVFACL
ncbi:MAG: hypothetical protein JWR21_2871 [Herminiimonas sp.]|nr:hypothetical protein [Herminiimonas sp.]